MIHRWKETWFNLPLPRDLEVPSAASLSSILPASSSCLNIARPGAHYFTEKLFHHWALLHNLPQRRFSHLFTHSTDSVHKYIFSIYIFYEPDTILAIEDTAVNN